MAQRGNRPIDPQDTKGGVRGTHGLGDAPRESGSHPVATRGGTASPTGGSRKGGTLSPSRVGGAVHERPAPEHDEATGEEHGFEMASAIGELESTEERARRREREAAVARDEIDEEAAMAGGEAQEEMASGEAEDEEVLGDPRSDEEERRERGLATETTPGPGPKDRDAGRARVQHLEDHRLRH